MYLLEKDNNFFTIESYDVVISEIISLPMKTYLLRDKQFDRNVAHLARNLG